jgi:cystathionine beta-synthase
MHVTIEIRPLAAGARAPRGPSRAVPNQTVMIAGDERKHSYFESALDAVGNTPLIRLHRTVEDVACTVLAKVEYVNPGGSVKDRPAVAMIAEAEEHGLLRPGSTIVEATSGNTGTGLAMAAAIRGYRCILVMPDKMSKEKIDLLRAYGAEVVVTPTNVPSDSAESYYGVASRLVSEIPGAFMPNQWHNRFNPEAHYRTTGPEIWSQTGGMITHFVSGIGTGGTISGTARYLKERNPKIHVVGADPEGSIYSGDTPKSFAVEGIGMSYLPETVDLKVIDEMMRVSDRESFLMARRIAREEGLLVGGSSGTAAVAALRLAKTLPKESILVVVFPDSGRGYMSKIFNDEWMIANGFLAEGRRKATVGDVLRSKEPLPPLITVSVDDVVKDALDLLRRYEISQLPVMNGGAIAGSVNDVGIMQAVFDRADLLQKPVRELMGRPFPVLDTLAEIDRAYKLLTLANSAILVMDGGHPIGVVTRQDIISFLSAGAADSSEG